MLKSHCTDDATSDARERLSKHCLDGKTNRWDGLSLARREELSNGQWAAIEPLLPRPSMRTDGKGRPRRDDRDVLNGILWILRSGARWPDLPSRFPPYHTCHRRFREWTRTGVLRSVLEALADDLRERGNVDVTECLQDFRCVCAQGAARPWEHLHGENRNSWQWQTALVFLSPSTRRLLTRMKSPLSKRLPPGAC
jgi:transposase